MSETSFPLPMRTEEDRREPPPNPFLSKKPQAEDADTPLDIFADPQPDPQQAERSDTGNDPNQSQHPATPTPTLDDIRTSAVHALTAGTRPAQVERAIVERCSLDPTLARQIVQEAASVSGAAAMTSAHAKRKRKACLWHLALGTLWFAGGVGVTVASVLAGHGGYLIAYSAIILGALEAAYGFVGAIYYTLKK